MPMTKDSSTTVTPAIQPRMPWRVVDVQPLDGFRLRVRFVDGLEGELIMFRAQFPTWVQAA